MKHLGLDHACVIYFAFIRDNELKKTPPVIFLYWYEIRFQFRNVLEKQQMASVKSQSRILNDIVRWLKEAMTGFSIASEMLLEWQ